MTVALRISDRTILLEANGEGFGPVNQTGVSFSSSDYSGQAYVEQQPNLPAIIPAVAVVGPSQALYAGRTGAVPTAVDIGYLLTLAGFYEENAHR